MRCRRNPTTRPNPRGYWTVYSEDFLTKEQKYIATFKLKESAQKLADELRAARLGRWFTYRWATPEEALEESMRIGSKPPSGNRRNPWMGVDPDFAEKLKKRGLKKGQMGVLGLGADAIDVTMETLKNAKKAAEKDGVSPGEAYQKWYIDFVKKLRDEYGYTEWDADMDLWESNPRRRNPWEVRIDGTEFTTRRTENDARKWAAFLQSYKPGKVVTIAKIGGRFGLTEAEACHQQTLLLDAEKKERQGGSRGNPIDPFATMAAATSFAWNLATSRELKRLREKVEGKPRDNPRGGKRAGAGPKQSYSMGYLAARKLKRREMDPLAEIMTDPSEPIPTPEEMAETSSYYDAIRESGLFAPAASHKSRVWTALTYEKMLDQIRDPQTRAKMKAFAIGLLKEIPLERYEKAAYDPVGGPILSYRGTGGGRRVTHKPRPDQYENNPDSKGHIAYFEGMEYFHGPDGDIYRAAQSSPIDIRGYRQGARFESTPASWAHFGLKLLRMRGYKGNPSPKPPGKLYLDALQKAGRWEDLMNMGAVRGKCDAGELREAQDAAIKAIFRVLHKHPEFHPQLSRMIRGLPGSMRNNTTPELSEVRTLARRTAAKYLRLARGTSRASTALAQIRKLEKELQSLQKKRANPLTSDEYNRVLRLSSRYESGDADLYDQGVGEGLRACLAEVGREKRQNAHGRKMKPEWYTQGVAATRMQRKLEESRERTSRSSGDKWLTPVSSPSGKWLIRGVEGGSGTTIYGPWVFESESEARSWLSARKNPFDVEVEGKPFGYPFKYKKSATALMSILKRSHPGKSVAIRERPSRANPEPISKALDRKLKRMMSENAYYCRKCRAWHQKGLTCAGMLKRENSEFPTLTSGDWERARGRSRGRTVPPQIISPIERIRASFIPKKTKQPKAPRGFLGPTVRTKRENPTLLIATNPGGNHSINPRLMRDPKFRAALTKYRQFFGDDPVEIVEVKDAPKGFSKKYKYLVGLGKAPEVTYAPHVGTPKGKGPPFMHEWDHKPYLALSADEKFLGYLGRGKGYKVKREGIHG
jgi:hypothetical protein